MRQNFSAYKSNFLVGRLLGTPSYVTMVATRSQYHVAPENGGDDISVALPNLNSTSQLEGAEGNIS
jgi:hypothetical protein